jgi:hypothetical protein
MASDRHRLSAVEAKTRNLAGSVTAAAECRKLLKQFVDPQDQERHLSDRNIIAQRYASSLSAAVSEAAMEIKSGPPTPSNVCTERSNDR